MLTQFKHLRTKLLLTTLAVIVPLTLAVLALVQQRMLAHVHDDLDAELQSESRVFNRIEQVRRTQAQQSVDFIADMPSLKALMSTNDHATVQDGSQSILDISHADMLVLCDVKGEVLAFHAKSEDVPLTAVKRLQQSSTGTQDWWFLGGHLFDVSFANIVSGAGSEQRALGRVLIGREITATSLSENSMFSDSWLAFVRDGKILQGTIPIARHSQFESWFAQSPPTGTSASDFLLGNERYIAHFVQLDGDHPVQLFFLRSYDQATIFLNSLNRLLITLGVVALLIAAFVSFQLSRQITRPLEHLAQGARQMEEGNFEFQLEAKGKDEVAQLTRAFEQMRKTLLENRDNMLRTARLEAVGRLAGGVAHDFNNLVTIISGYSDLLLLTATDATRPKLEEIKRAGQRATALTRQLLAFSRKQVLEPQVLDPNATVKSMVKMLQVLIGEDIELVTNLSEQVGRVFADPGQLEQVIMNLSVNARDAMPEGGKLIIETQQTVLDDKYAESHTEVKPGPFVQITVTDSGTGIPPEILKHIFEPFFTTKEAGKGTGLGLATVYGIVKQSKAHISVYSEVGHGTSFKVYLPSLDKAIPLANTQPIETILHGEGTILLVEDESALRVLAAESLKHLGYTVLQAGNGLEALALADQHEGNIDFVLTDIVMPRMGGPEFIKKLKEKRTGFATIYMSGYTETAVLENVNIGSEALLINKPFTTESLARRIREAHAKKSS